MVINPQDRDWEAKTGKNSPVLQPQVVDPCPNNETADDASEEMGEWVDR